jgi:hypothetical protein
VIGLDHSVPFGTEVKKGRYKYHCGFGGLVV